MAYGFSESCKTCEYLRKYEAVIGRGHSKSREYGYMCCLFLLERRYRDDDRDHAVLNRVDDPENDLCEAWTPIREDK